MAKLEKINKTENKYFFFILKKKKTALVPQLELHTTTFRFLVFLTFRFFDVIDHHRNLLVAPAPLFYFFFLSFSLYYLLFSIWYFCLLCSFIVFPSIPVVGYTTNLPFFFSFHLYHWYQFQNTRWV